MVEGYLYFVKDKFYERFEKYGLMVNKPASDGSNHNRPCCCVLKFKEDEQLYWLVPISSKIEKYEAQYNRSVEKYGVCDNISFGYVMGRKSAFLTQNLFPITEEYINNVYIDCNTSLPVSVPADLLAELKAKARKKLRYNMSGKKFGYSDTATMYEILKKGE